MSVQRVHSGGTRPIRASEGSAPAEPAVADGGEHGNLGDHTEQMGSHRHLTLTSKLLSTPGLPPTPVSHGCGASPGPLPSRILAIAACGAQVT